MLLARIVEEKMRANPPQSVNESTTPCATPPAPQPLY